MERALSWIRENPQFAAIGLGAAVLALVMTILAVIMSRSGVSLRPLGWFFVLFMIVAGPQAVVHFLDGLALRRAAAANSNSAERAAVAADHADAEPALAPVAWPVVFGPNADPALITDAKQSLAAVLNDALEAKLSFSAEGSSALAARLPSIGSAGKALNQYRTFFSLTGARGSDVAGWTGRRHGGQGEWVHVVRAGPELYAWTGSSEAAVIDQRIRALGPMASPPVAAAGERRPEPELFSTRLRARTGLMAAFVVLNLVVAVGWFFKGSAWAARVGAVSSASPSGVDSLRGAILALKVPDLPTDVFAQPDGTIEITWRYADARWFDVMRLHQMKRTQRLVLAFDEASHAVRVREYWSAFDASAGPGGLRLNWVNATGIQFFAVEHNRVFGAQLGPDGKPTGALSSAYTFDLQALKAPVIETVTRAGWTWQPVIWSVPASLRWLAE